MESVATFVAYTLGAFLANLALGYAMRANVKALAKEIADLPCKGRIVVPHTVC